MSPRELLADLAARGIELSVEEGTRLKYRAPKGAVTPEVTALLKARKAELLELLAADGAPSAGIPRLPDAPDYALSPAQWRLWILMQMEHAAAAYAIPLHFELAGPLDRAALDRAFCILIARHESLRTNFILVDGQPRQVVRAAWPAAIGCEDLSAAPDPVAAARAAGRRQTAAPFDLARDPLIRVALLRLAPERHVVLLTLHHIIADGTSFGVLVREFSQLYGAFAAGRPDPLAPLPLQYRDYAAWQQAQLQSTAFAAHRAYWHAQLGGELPVLDLPADHPRPATMTYRGAERLFALDRARLDGLQALARRHDATLFMVLNALVKLLLHRHSGQTDLIIGSPVAGRTHPDLAGQVGFYINTVALRDRLDPAAPFADLLRAVRATTLAAFDHQAYPFDHLVNELPLRRDVTRSPIFDVMLVLQNQDERAHPVAGVTLRSFLEPSDTAKLDLTFLFKALDDRLQGAIEYNRDLFAAATMARLADHFVTLVDAVLADRGVPVGLLPLLGEEERRRVLEENQGVSGKWSSGRTLGSWFETQAQERPEASAVTSREEGVELSYGELNVRANRLAHALRRQGVGPEERVGMYFERGAELVIGQLGIVKAGGAYVPFDPIYPAERIAGMLADARPRVLLTQAKHAAYCEDLIRQAGVATELLILGSAVIDAEPSSNPEPQAGPDHAAYVIYTSGSTGKPKGCIVTHHQAVRLFEATEAWYGFGPADVWTLFHSYAFDFSVWEIWGALLYGGRLVVVPYTTSRSPEAFFGLLAEERVSVLNQTPSAFRQLIAADDGRALSLRHVIFGGEALDIGSLKPWWDRRGDQVPRLVNMYGITETTVHVSYRPLGREDLKAGGSVIGGPIPDLKIYVLDNYQQPVPIGVTGEIYVGGAGVARGYLNRPELTAERFVPDPFGKPGSRLYRSGDLARWRADGELEYLGRADHQVKIRGFRIELGEIEAALSSHPQVDSSLVVVSKDGTGENRLVGYVVAKAGMKPEVAELRAQAKQRVPDYMVPAAIVVLERWPLTPNGKLDRRALPQPEATRAAGADYVAPRDGVETAVAAVWAEVLGLARVGATDHFFELGGHSLKATQVVARLRKDFSEGCTIGELFRRPVLADFAAGLRAVAAVPVAEVAGASAPVVGLEAPVSAAQRRLWIIDRMMPGLPTYNIATALELQGSVDAAALRQAVRWLVERHEVLRTTLVERAGEPVAVVGPAETVGWKEIDLSGHPDPAAEARALAAAEAATPFDLARGPLLRVTLVRLGPERYQLLLTMHHVVSDAWSAGILSRELTALYEAAAQGRGNPLAPLAWQYRDHAQWEAQHLAGPAGARLAAAWRERLGGAPTALDLPTDYPRPAVQSPSGRTHRFAFGPAASAALIGLGRGSGATPFMVLVALVKVLLLRYTGQTDLSVGTPIAGRERVETEGLIGFFVNTLVLRDTVTAADSFRTLLGRVRGTCLAAYADQAYPFDRLVEDLQLARDFSRSLLFDVSVQLLEADEPAVGTGGLRLTEIDHGFAPAKCDLSFDFVQGPDGLACSLTWSTALFTEARIGRLAEHVLRLAEIVTARPDEAVGRLDYLSVAERRRVLVEFNPPVEPGASGETLTGWLARVAGQRPEAVALRDGGATLSFGELEAGAGRLAAVLQARGLGAGQVVAVGLERGAAWAQAMVAVMKAGAVYLPIDPALPAARIALLLEDSAVARVITSRDLAPKFAGSVPCLLWEEVAAENVAAPAVRPLSGPGPDDVAYLIYTSGSTGRPKGVLVEHRAIVNTLRDQTRRLGLSPADRVLQFASLSFDASLFEAWNAWLAGAALVIAPGAARTDPREFLRLLHAERVTVAVLPPSFVRSLGRADLPLRVLFTAGEAADAGDAVHYAARLTYVNGYGPTEAAICSTVHVLAAGESCPLGVPIGRPLAGTRAYVLDGAGQPVPVGVPGELWVAGAGVARGYLGRPELTAERFGPDPFVSGGRMYRTGDRCRWRDDGVLEFLGRVDAQIKLRGFRIEPGEIEAVLRELPGVREAAVVPRGEGDRTRLVGYVVAQTGVRADESALLSALRARLPDYLVPATLVFLPELPLSTAGKIDRRSLPAPPSEVAGAVAPRDDLERALAGLVAEVLRVPAVGALDSFFQLGGNSLLAIQVLGRVRDTFRAEVGVPQFFAQPTVAGLAAALRTDPATAATVEKIARALARLAAMSPEEKQRLLAQRRGGA